MWQVFGTRGVISALSRRRKESRSGRFAAVMSLVRNVVACSSFIGLVRALLCIRGAAIRSPIAGVIARVIPAVVEATMSNLRGGEARGCQDGAAALVPKGSKKFLGRLVDGGGKFEW